LLLGYHDEETCCVQVRHFHKYTLKDNNSKEKITLKVPAS
jgi:hypothetical protein